jgi:hypothetical protein
MHEMWMGYLNICLGSHGYLSACNFGERFKQQGNIQVDKPGETLVKIDKIIYKVTSKYVDKKPLEKVAEQIIKRKY